MRLGFNCLTCAVSAAFLLVGCDQDPLGRMCPRINAEYCLQKFENGKAYYIQRIADFRGGGGYLDGPVERVGWNKEKIVAYVRPMFEGDAPGYYSINMKTGDVSRLSDGQNIEMELVYSETMWHRLRKY